MVAVNRVTLDARISVAPLYSLYGQDATTVAVAPGRLALAGTAGVVVDATQGVPMFG